MEIGGNNILQGVVKNIEKLSTTIKKYDTKFKLVCFNTSFTCLCKASDEIKEDQNI